MPEKDSLAGSIGEVETHSEFPRLLAEPKKAGLAGSIGEVAARCIFGVTEGLARLLAEPARIFAEPARILAEVLVRLLAVPACILAELLFTFLFRGTTVEICCD